MSEYPKIGSVTTHSVHKATGKHWREWVALLDKQGARSWPRSEIVAHLAKRHKLSPWWQQQVTAGYEVAIGRREEGRTIKGELTLTATKSMNVSAAAAWKLLMSPAGMEIWLQPLSPVELKPKAMFETTDGYYGEVRTMLAGRRARLTWQDPNWEKKTVVQLFIVPRPGGRCIVAFSHDHILDTRVRDRMRARWREALEALNAQAPPPKSRRAPAAPRRRSAR